MKQTWIFVGVILGVGLLTLVLLLVFQDSSNPYEDDSDFTTMPSGVKYKDLRVGTGKEVVVGDHISVHYTGTLRNGKVFDSSRWGNKAFELRLDNSEVIRGWVEGIAGMKAGGRRILIIPPQLGYGAKQTGEIPANAVLYFDVEVLKVN